MKAIILAGGKGTRMGDYTKSVPKPMVLLAGIPVIEHQIKFMKKNEIEDIYILLGYKGKVIKNYFEGGGKWGVKIKYFFDPKPLGTAGSLKEVEHLVTDPFLLFYGDTIIDIDVNQFIKFYERKSSIASLVVHPNDHPIDSDLLDIDNENYVTKFYSKPHKNGFYPRNLVNAALYILNPKIFKYIKKGVFSDFGKHIFPLLLSEGKPIRAYNTTEYIKDIGTPDRLAEVENDFLSGKVKQLNKENKQRAIFLDRDGVVNKELDKIDSIKKFSLLPKVEEAIKNINKSEYLNVIVTNQPIVAKGFISEKKLHEIHNYMETKLGLKGAYFNRIYYCPHHPEKGHEGEREDYKIICNCRKPGTGMIEHAIKDMNIDPQESFIIGDRTVDIMTGINSKLQTILLRQGYAGNDKKYDCKSDFVFNDLFEASNFILNDFQKIYEKIKTYFDSIDNVNGRMVIAIGGLSRSGKTTFSSVLKKYFYELDIHPLLIQLDNWLLPLKNRKEAMTVRDRYQYNIIKKDINSLLEGEKIKIKKYDSQTRENFKTSDEITPKNSKVIILEGVIALDNSYIRDISDQLFFVRTSEFLRKKRFKSFYLDKKLSLEEIDTLYLERENDETPIVLESAKYANKIIDMEFL